MNAFLLEGWTPILLLGTIFIFVMYFMSRKVSRKALYTISLMLSLICISLVIYSIFVIGGWEGMGIGFIAISVLVGVWIGTIIGIL